VIRLFIAVLVVFLTVPAMGQELKVGLVNIQRAVSQSKRGEKARETFQRAQKDKQATLLKEQQSIKRDKQRLDKQAALMKEGERIKVQRRFQLRVRDYERRIRDGREELALREREMTDEILKELQKVITEIGKTGNFAMILERGQVLYTDKGTDITDDVIRLYNERSQGEFVDKGK